jgi:ubiquitin thioesterase protein OTUB1
MYQPQPTAFLQVSTGYAMPHSLPEYTFDETPLRLSDGRGSATGGAGGNAASALLYGTSLFSANSPGVGPASSASGGSFNFHSTSSSSSTTTAAAAASSTITAPSHHRPSLPILLKMEPNTDDLVAQEAAAREYQPHLQVNKINQFLVPNSHPQFRVPCSCVFFFCGSRTPRSPKPRAAHTGTTRRQEDTK